MGLHNRDNKIKDAVLMLSSPETVDCMQVHIIEDN